jgi:uncharacterized protein
MLNHTTNTNERTCYLSPKVEVRDAGEKGVGLFAKEAIKQGELVSILAGDVIGKERLTTLDHTFSVQVEEDLYITPIGLQSAYRLNHSCNPSVGLVGQITFLALRDLQPGDEICYDYAMSDGTPYDEFECKCGAPNCRKNITGDDWKNPELWERYAGHFSPYLQRRIDKLKAEQQK